VRRISAFVVVLVLLLAVAPVTAVGFVQADAVPVADTFVPASQFQAFLYRLGEDGAMNYGDFLVKYLPWFGLRDEDRVFLYGEFAGLPYNSAKWNAWLVGFEAEMVP